MATRKMEVSDAMILLAVDGSSLFLAHKADKTEIVHAEIVFLKKLP